MFSWFGASSSSSPAGDNNNSNEDEDSSGDNNSGDSDANMTSNEGMFSGAFNMLKGMVFGVDNLKIEETDNNSGSNRDVEDENKRKGLFSQLSSYIGKDITSMISLPVWIFEPVSFLQVMSEPLQYEFLLTKAADCDSSLDRLALIAAFNCALYSTAIRTRKPFNPILGETFEIVEKNNKFKYIAEQVSHHPPIGVSETVSKHYTLQLETELKSKFYGNSSEILIQGTNHITFTKCGYNTLLSYLTYGRTSCHNIILGALWLDHYGDLVIENHTTSERCVLKFIKSGWLGAGRYSVNGEILDKDGRSRIKLHGKWNQSLYGNRIGPNGRVGEDYLIWEASKDPITNKHNFPKFIVDEVINLSPEYEVILPSCDSRLREDRRALEVGDLEKAARFKYEMEEAQRARKRERDAKDETWTTKYFKKVDDPKFGHRWLFNGLYWIEREERVKKINETKSESTQ